MNKHIIIDHEESIKGQMGIIEMSDNTSYHDLCKNLSLKRKKYKQLHFDHENGIRDNEKEMKLLLSEIRELDSTIKKIDSLPETWTDPQKGNYEMQVGSYEKVKKEMSKQDLKRFLATFIIPVFGGLVAFTGFVVWLIYLIF